MFSDFQSALRTMQSLKKLPTALNIQIKIKKAENHNKRINLCWVPGHCGVAGNEATDKAAKEQMT